MFNVFQYRTVSSLKNLHYFREHNFAMIRKQSLRSFSTAFAMAELHFEAKRLSKRKKKKKRKCQSGVGGRGKYQTVGCGEKTRRLLLSLSLFLGFSVFAAKREEPCTHG